MAAYRNKGFLFKKIGKRVLVVDLSDLLPVSDMKISAIIIAKNEEAKINECLGSLKWCDEIVFIDTGSTDKTEHIARKYTDKIYDYEKGSYADWRNEGLKHAKGEWILYVDADERVSDGLEKEIISLTTNYDLSTTISAYAIPRRNIILGREMKHGNWWPDYVKRLFKKNKLNKWIGEVHEEPIFKGRMGHLEKPLLHIKEDNISEMVEKTNIWSEIEARLLYNSNHPKMNIFRFTSAMFREFWLRMVKHKAFLDGSEGIIYAVYQVWSKFITYSKLWEFQIKSVKNEREK